MTRKQKAMIDSLQKEKDTDRFVDAYSREAARAFVSGKREYLVELRKLAGERLEQVIMEDIIASGNNHLVN